MSPRSGGYTVQSEWETLGQLDPCLFSWMMSDEAARLDTCFFTSYGLAGSTTGVAVSMFYLQ